MQGINLNVFFSMQLLMKVLYVNTSLYMYVKAVIWLNTYLRVSRLSQRCTCSLLYSALLCYVTGWFVVGTKTTTQSWHVGHQSPNDAAQYPRKTLVM
jgi:antibiotic biosynthesis monooxygenase (ABM) superfamily enzyme